MAAERRGEREKYAHKNKHIRSVYTLHHTGVPCMHEEVSAPAEK